MNRPELSIIMPVYNREVYVAESIRSILSQTYTDFEFIIINDGSTDRSEEIINQFTNDNRVILLNNESNKGIVFSRNKGLATAKGKYIAMFDSDDIAYPDKFEKQIEFLNVHNEIAMVGTWVKHIDEKGNYLKTKWKLTSNPDRIPAMMLFRNYFVQASIVVRKSAIPKEGYSEGYDIVEDSKMWFDISLKHKVANYQEFLLDYRIHTGGVSNQGNIKHKENSKKLFKYIFDHLGFIPSEEELDLHYLIKNSDSIIDYNNLKKIEKWLLKIEEKNKIAGIYDPKILKKVIFNRWIKSCFKARSLHFKMLFALFTSKLSYYNLF